MGAGQAIKTEITSEAFAEQFVKNGMNGTKAAQTLKPHLSYDSARQEAHTQLTKPHSREAMVKALENAGLTEDAISKIHRRNVKQGKNLPASNSALDMLYKINGTYAPEKSMSVNVHVDVSDPAQLENEIKATLAEIQGLDSLSNIE